MILKDHKESKIENPKPEPKLEAEATKLEEFAKTSTAAKMSGTFHEAVGSIKSKFGEFTDDAELKDAGRDQKLLGKVHRLVGTIRKVREVAVDKFNETRKESLVICRKHGGRALDVASDFAEDLRKLLLK